jgi:hypothetical protein
MSDRKWSTCVGTVILNVYPKLYVTTPKLTCVTGSPTGISNQSLNSLLQVQNPKCIELVVSSVARPRRVAVDAPGVHALVASPLVDAASLVSLLVAGSLVDAPLGGVSLVAGALIDAALGVSLVAGTLIDAAVHVYARGHG